MFINKNCLSTNYNFFKLDIHKKTSIFCACITFFLKVQVLDVNTTPLPSTSQPGPCEQFGTCSPIPDNGPFQAEGQCERCFCQCVTSGKYNETCCKDGLVFNPAINHCDWPFNVEKCP